MKSEELNKDFNALQDVSFSAIQHLDVCIINGSENFVGLRFDKNTMNTPMFWFKWQGELSRYFCKCAEDFNIPIVENKILAKSLYENSESGQTIPQKYEAIVKDIYEFGVKKEKPSDMPAFDWELQKDFTNQIFSFERNAFKDARRKFLKRKNKPNKDANSEVITKELSQQLKALAKLYSLDFTENKYLPIYDKEFYLVSGPNGLGVKLSHMVFVCDSWKTIFVGNKYCFQYFDFSEVRTAINFLGSLLKEYESEFEQKQSFYIEEFDISQAIFERAIAEMKIALVRNYNKTGLKYGYIYNKTVLEIYIQKNSSDLKKMYRFLITPKEFLRSPGRFKKMIAEPFAIVNKWNFCRSEVKYDGNMLSCKTGFNSNK